MWKEKNNTLEKDFTFNNFKDALEFINKVGDLSERLNHHPEIYNIYNKVTLKLSTHDMGDIVTDKDYQLSSEIDKIK